MTGTSSNAILKIIKGLPKIPGYSASAEVGVDELDLLDPLGYSCYSYDIQIPNLKSGAVFADSPITDGRTLISGALGNLTETIRLQLTAGTLIQMAAMLSRLAKFRENCHDFWQSMGQIEPVYLKHQIEGEPGPRYALLYNIEINVESPLEPGDPQRTVTLSIEREPAWRGLAPGDNPKRWTVEHAAGQTWNSASADLIAGINHFAYTTTLFNCIEFLNQGAIDRKNYIDIPAANIPGSAPALVEIDIDPNGSNTLQNAYLARSTKPTSLTNRDGNTVLQYNTLPAVTALTLGADTTLVDDTGGIAYPPTKAARQRGQVSFATDTGLKARFTWTTNSATTTKPRLSSQVLRGRYLVFCRARQVGGAVGEVTLQLSASNISNVVGDFPSSTVTIQAGTGNTSEWPVVYLGVITIPSIQRSTVGLDGRGTYVWDGTSAHDDFTLSLMAGRNAATAVVYVSDLILIPFDECCVKWDNNVTPVTYDNSHYLTHGTPEHVAAGRTETVVNSPYDAPFSVELSGQPLTLLPGVDNRIYFFNKDTTGNGSESITQASYTARMNIIPRWYGFRDA